MRFMKYCSVLVALLLFGCSALQQPIETLEAIKKCKFTVKKVDPKVNISAAKVSLSGIKPPEVTIHFNTQIEAANTTKKDLKFNKFHLDLLVDGKKFTKFESNNRFSIKPGKSKLIKAKFIVDGKNATEKIAKKIEGKKVRYQIDGTFYFDINGIEFPLQLKLKEGKG